MEKNAGVTNIIQPAVCITETGDHYFMTYTGNKYGMYSPMYLQCVHCGKIIQKDEPFPKIEQSH